MGYYPPPCELEKIVNMTIAACDELDGAVTRTDLCKPHFTVNSTIGASYSCAASTNRTILKYVSIDSTTPA